MVLQQCPISRGKKCTYPITSTEYGTMKLERTFFFFKVETFINQMAQEALDSFPQVGCTCIFKGTMTSSLDNG